MHALKVSTLMVGQALIIKVVIAHNLNITGNDRPSRRSFSVRAYCYVPLLLTTVMYHWVWYITVVSKSGTKAR